MKKRYCKLPGHPRDLNPEGAKAFDLLLTFATSRGLLAPGTKKRILVALRKEASGPDQKFGGKENG
jgi:hypothetical protein